jgi:hypothetical protein
MFVIDYHRGRYTRKIFKVVQPPGYYASLEEQPDLGIGDQSGAALAALQDAEHK